MGGGNRSAGGAAARPRGAGVPRRFAPNGQLITNCLDGAVHVWDWRKGTAAAEAKTPKYAFVALPGPNGRRLAVGCDGESLRLLDAVTGEAVTPSIQLSGAPWTVEFSTDGTHVAIAGSGSAIDVVDLSPLDAPLDSPSDALLRAELTSDLRVDGGELRRLTPDEWIEGWERQRKR